MVPPSHNKIAPLLLPPLVRQVSRVEAEPRINVERVARGIV